MGLTESDYEALKNLNNTAKIEENYSLEQVINGEATKIYGITEEINNVSLVTGRMPEENQECLVLDGTYKLDEIIQIPNENLINQEFKVVGTVKSSMYIYNNLGTSTVSDG